MKILFFCENFQVSDSKHSTKHLFRSRRADGAMVNYLKNNNFASITKEAPRFQDHYRHHLDETQKRHKRFLVKENNWNRWKQFIRYVQHEYTNQNNSKITFTHFYLSFDISTWIYAWDVWLKKNVNKNTMMLTVVSSYLT